MNKAEKLRRRRISRSMKRLFKGMTPKEKREWSKNRRGLSPTEETKEARRQGLVQYYEELGEEGRKGRGWKGKRGQARRQSASKLLTKANNNPKSGLRKGVKRAADSGKTSKAAKASHNTPEFKKLRSVISKKVWKEQSDIMAQAIEQRSTNEEWKKNLKRSAKNPIRRKRISEKKAAWWKSLTDDERNAVVSKVLSSSKRKPNKIEKLLSKRFSELGHAYRYVGDGKFFIGRKCPDFVDEGNKRVVELDGAFWHNKKEDAARNKMYVSKGWRVLCLSYYDVFDAVELKVVVDRFHDSSQDIVQSPRRRAGK